MKSLLSLALDSEHVENTDLMNAVQVHLQSVYKLTIPSYFESSVRDDERAHLSVTVVLLL